MPDQLLLKLPSGRGRLGDIRAEPNAELMADAAALQGFPIGGQVTLAIVFPFPALIRSFGFPHVKQQRLFKIGRPVQHQVDRGSPVRALGPSPEAQGQGSECQWPDGGDGFLTDIPEQ